MSWCSEWIRDWLRGGTRTQLELARMAGVDAGSVSRWLSGQSLPDGEILTRFAGRLPERELAALVVAWLNDQLAEPLRGLVEIAPAAGLEKEPEVKRVARPVVREPGEDFHRFGAELRERLEYFGMLSIHNPAIRKILDVCYDAAKAAERNG